MMNKIAYLECATGIAGDMCLGALIHAGVPLDYLIEHLNRLGIAPEYQLRAETVHRNTQHATKAYVDLTSEKGHCASQDSGENQESPTFAHHHQHDHKHHHHQHDHVEHDRVDDEISLHHTPHRHLPAIEKMILSAKLPKRVETWSLAIFRNLAIAEGLVHGIAPEEVHFHEVGATDAIVDIVGTCLGLDWLEIDELYCSPLPTGGGTIKTAHGLLKVPTPAVLQLWEMGQVPVYSNGITRELVTPTGAAIVVSLAKSFGEPPAMKLQKMGLGAGSRQLEIPNILRLWIGEKLPINNPKVGAKHSGTKPRLITNDLSAGMLRPNEIGMLPLDPPTSERDGFLRDELSTETQSIVVLETQIDDLNPQAIAYLFDLLLEAGALDVFTQPIVMKKSRLGVLLTVICLPEKQQECEVIIFRETTTLGIRYSRQQRSILEREIHLVKIEYGEVRVKIAKMGETVTNVQPEYEDCAAIAKSKNISWREVHRLVLESWYQHRDAIVP
jgi:uncharacterized protein (TIGR00299 family) protein